MDAAQGIFRAKKILCDTLMVDALSKPTERTPPEGTLLESVGFGDNDVSVEAH